MSITQTLISQSETLWKKFIHVFDALELQSAAINSIISPSAPILFNGNPIAGNSAFEQLLASLPTSQHYVNNWDCHAVGGMTGTGVVNISLTGKCRYDESGKRRVVNQPTGGSSIGTKSNWFGFHCVMIVNENIDQILSLDYRLVYAPEDTILKVV